MIAVGNVLDLPVIKCLHSLKLAENKLNGLEKVQKPTS